MQKQSFGCTCKTPLLLTRCEFFAHIASRANEKPSPSARPGEEGTEDSQARPTALGGEARVARFARLSENFQISRLTRLDYEKTNQTLQFPKNVKWDIYCTMLDFVQHVPAKRERPDGPQIIDCCLSAACCCAIFSSRRRRITSASTPPVMRRASEKEASLKSRTT